MKHYIQMLLAIGGIQLAIITATTLFLFIPISAFTDSVITQIAYNAYDDDHPAINNGFVALDASSKNTEQWALTLDDGQGSGNVTLIEKEDGTITANGNWVYTYQGSNVSGPYTEAPVTIAESSLAITASGTATDPSAPPGYTTSPFTLGISGTAFDRQGSGTFIITFQAVGWPDRISGTWEGTRTSGSGITAPIPESKVLSWIMLLLKD